MKIMMLFFHLSPFLSFFVKENYYEKDSYHIVLGIKGRERKEKMNEISFFFRENEMSKNTVLGSSTIEELNVMPFFLFAEF